MSKETFERFVQFAYTGDYSIPSPVSRTRVTTPKMAGTDVSPLLSRQGTSNGELEWEQTVKEDDKPLAVSIDPRDEFEFFRTPKKDKKKKKGISPWPEPEPVEELPSRREPYPEPRSPQLPTKLLALSYPLSAPRNNYEDSCEPAKSLEKGQSYSNVFLSHASLFLLADYHLIDSLKDLALFKLHKTLCGFDLDGENTVDIIDLARYAYSDEGRGSKKGVGSLRSLICQFMAEKALILSSDTGFAELLSEGGQLPVDLFKFTVQLIHS